MIFVRLLAARLLFVLFPIVGLGSILSTLPAATPASPILIVRLPGAPAIETTVAQAGGYRVGVIPPAIGQVVHSQDPAFLSRLRASGAFLLLNADQLPDFLCGRYA